LTAVEIMVTWLPLVVAPPLANAPTPGSFVSWNACGRFGSLLDRFAIAA
jgi:hypothetical protein